jgi:two-component system, NarL family, response regulator NreC
MATNIVIADDHHILRHGLRTLLQQQPDFHLVGEAATGRDAIAMIAEHRPDIAVIDITMPDIDGIEVTRQIHEQTETKVVALSMHTEPRLVREMIGAGASAYLLKDDAFDELVRAVRAVLNGEMYFSQRIRAVAMGDGEPSCTVDRLSPRERQVLQLISEGQSTKEIAFHLKLSTKTIETHRRQIMQKLDLYSVAELTKCAIREGLTGIEAERMPAVGFPTVEAARAARN